MHIQTFSIVIGTKVCNAHCPFCISKQTGFFGTPVNINWRNFAIACKLAQKADTTTVLLTGKGEPTLYPSHVTETLKELQPYNFPLIEIQTNGLTIASGERVTDDVLRRWYDLGLTTIAISVVHWDAARNKEIYCPGDTHFNLAAVIAKLRGIGFSVRIGVMLLNGFIDSPATVQQMINFCKKNDVTQLTFRNITTSVVTSNASVTEWTKDHAIGNLLGGAIAQYIQTHGTLLQHLMHGMDVYDMDGQNVCLGNALTHDANQANDFRQLIFFPDGSLYWDWQFKGARIL
jgi:molybdenum cofactor biosynthesis enzyme MoaA